MNKGKIIIFTIIALAISFFLAFFFSNSNSFNGAQTVYRVYLNGVSIGLIKDKEELENYIDTEQEALKKEYNVDRIYIPKGLEIKKELTYSNSLDESKLIYEKIKDIEPFTIEGYVVTIYGQETTGYDDVTEENAKDVVTTDIQTIVYVLNKEIFEQAIKNTIFVFVDETNYDKYVNELQQDIADLSVGQYIENVYIKEKITFKKDYIPVGDEIFTDSKTLARYFLYSTLKEQKTYVVKSGDTVSNIANNNKLNVKELLIANRNIASENTLLYVGQKVVVDPVSPLFTVVEEIKEAVYQEKDYLTEIQEDSSFYVGYAQVLQQGVKGEEYVTRHVMKQNGVTTTVLNINNVETKSPISRIVKTGIRTQFAVGNTGIWAWPTKSGYSITTYYGHDNSLGYYRFHAAIDIAGMGCNSPIYAANDGTVIAVAYNSSLGNYITINHNNGYVTTYAHLNKQYVSTGQAVSMGETIGLMGSTGYSFGCHLHFVAKYNGNTFDPLQLYR